MKTKKLHLTQLFFTNEKTFDKFKEESPDSLDIVEFTALRTKPYALSSSGRPFENRGTTKEACKQILINNWVVWTINLQQKRKKIKTITLRNDHRQMYVPSTSKKGVSSFDEQWKHMDAIECEPWS